MRRNPKTEVSSWLDELLPSQMEKAARIGKAIQITFDHEKGRRVLSLSWGGGQRDGLAMILPDRQEIAVYGADFFNSPSVVHALYALLAPRREMFSVYKLTEFDAWFGGSHTKTIKTIDTGYTVDRFVDEVKLITEESVVRSGRWGDDEKSKTFEYLAIAGPQEMLWYHATLRSNLDSIATYGLRPSSLEQGRKEGWSPGWNMQLQRAVYLTSSIQYAVRIAYTLASNTGSDAAIISVDGSALTDTKLLTYDEDALRSDLDDTVLFDDHDVDFPQWVTSAEHRVRSVAYRGVIKPSGIKLVAVAKYGEEQFARGYSDDPDDVDVEVDIRWVGDEAASVAGDYGRPLKEALRDREE